MLADVHTQLRPDPSLRIKGLPRSLVLHQFDSHHEALVPKVANVWEIAQIVQYPSQRLGLLLHRTDQIVLLKQLQRCDRRGAGKRVSSVRVTMIESLSFPWLAQESIKDLLRGERCRQRQIAAA